MSQAALKTYLASIEQALKTGQSGEHTHRPALEALLEALGGSGVDAINEPRQIACGAPDFIVVRGTVPLGYVEAKDVGSDLDKIERSEQLDRYRESLANLVLTDYLQFRWYLDGECKLTASLPQPDRNGRIRFDADAASEVAQLLQQFLLADIPLKSTPQDLATRMAGLAKLIRDLIAQTFKAEGDSGELHGQLTAFRNVLIESLSVKQFADMYAQTLCYGLFAARCNAPAAGFTRQRAASALPKTNPFLRKLFNTIAGPDLDERIAWAVDQLAELLARADMAAILSDFGKRTRQEDPVVHFYETFLAAYDPKMREARGVYYTPEPVVGYIVRSVDALLKRDFGMKDGLAHAKKIKLKRPKTQGKGEETYETHRLQILDPATGTGTFLYAVIAKIRERFDGNAGAWPGYVADHLLPRLFGFELLMAPYAVAHMKLGLELEQSGYDFRSDERLGVFLTNSLEQAHELTGLPLFTQWLAEESRAASSVKRDAPVMVVLGNPPYSGHSANTGEWIAGLLRGHDSLGKRDTENYFEVDGGPLGERNPKWLNDDYVKFIRFAQWRIEQTDHGILAFVTNHGYLDNPTFRGMRQSLMQGFDEIYLLDLHGNSKKKEKAPDGGKDENVFDIQQGVAVGIFVRHADATRDKDHHARVFHADLHGTRAAKYAALDAGELGNTAWTELAPASPSYYFVPQDAELAEEYARGWKITEVMPVNGWGVATRKDYLIVDFDKDKIRGKFERIKSQSSREAINELGIKKSPHWSFDEAHKLITQEPSISDAITPMLFRPFDTRYVFYRKYMIERGDHRMELMRHFINGSPGLITVRRVEDQVSECHAFATNTPSVLHSTSAKEGNFVFPLWLYPSEEPTDLLDTTASEKRPNLAPEFVTALTKAVGHTSTPEDTLAWIYAVLYAPSYRARYADFLKRDFPRVPLTTDRTLFDALVAAGRELIALHTMDETLPRITRFDVAGSNEVGKVRFAASPLPPAGEGGARSATGEGAGDDGVAVRESAADAPPSALRTPSPASGGRDEGDEAAGRVYINDAQYFDGVPQAVWDMHIGGYRVAEKWLKDRKGRQLSYDELTHYQSVLAALARTLVLQADIDAAIATAGGWPLH